MQVFEHFTQRGKCGFDNTTAMISCANKTPAGRVHSQYYTDVSLLRGSIACILTATHHFMTSSSSSSSCQNPKSTDKLSSKQIYNIAPFPLKSICVLLTDLISLEEAEDVLDPGIVGKSLHPDQSAMLGQHGRCGGCRVGLSCDCCRHRSWWSCKVADRRGRNGGAGEGGDENILPL